MISSASSSERTPNLGGITPAVPAAPRPYTPRPDRVSTESAAFLRTQLTAQPEIRPEVVARARTLAADPNYPPREVIQHVARQILASPDISEDDSGA